MISNGTDLVGSADWVKYVTTGAILLAAVTLDTVARRRQAAAGRCAPALFCRRMLAGNT